MATNQLEEVIRTLRRAANSPEEEARSDRQLLESVRRIALEEKIVVQQGVFVAVPGPNLETRAEYRFLRGIGADVVGMSTVPEVIVGVHSKLRILGLSVITDMCLPDALEPAKLEVDPPEIDLGTVQVGEERRFDVVLRNGGDRLVFGKAAADECPWLVLGDSGASEKLFQFVDQAVIPVRVRPDRLRAYTKPQKGEIVLESNGGNLIVAVSVTVWPSAASGADDVIVVVVVSNTVSTNVVAPGL